MLSLAVTIWRLATQATWGEGKIQSFGYFMIGLWLVASLVLTFSIFEVAGNGFFGSWGCFAVSLYMQRDQLLTAERSKMFANMYAPYKR
mmetsp:Transcript_8585/g.10856  ORF Transcript_8585/g.10856 Transcript_8585/m.10856 type:complete len:89 (-) Transcript_8585:11-277(-)